MVTNQPTAKAEESSSFTLIYYRAGIWHRSLVFGDFAYVMAKVCTQIIAGRWAYAKTVKELGSIGLPEGLATGRGESPNFREVELARSAREQWEAKSPKAKAEREEEAASI